MYIKAVSQKSVSQKVNEIRANKDFVKLDEISDKYIDNLLKSEDKRFYYHFGVDPIAIGRAAYNNIKAGSFVQGGSTITQQLAKNMYFTFEKKYERKIAELFVAFELEMKLSKNEILELYCNVIYFGEGCYGINEASKHYFNKEPINLSEKEASLLVYTIKSPNNYNPNSLKSQLNPKFITSE